MKFQVIDKGKHHIAVMEITLLIYKNWAIRVCCYLLLRYGDESATSTSAKFAVSVSVGFAMGTCIQTLRALNDVAQ